jgi:hypothetical protein
VTSVAGDDAAALRVRLERQALAVEQDVIGGQPHGFLALAGINRPRIFRILGFSPPLAYRIGRLELYAAQRPARFDDFFLPP